MMYILCIHRIAPINKFNSWSNTILLFLFIGIQIILEKTLINCHQRWIIWITELIQSELHLNYPSTFVWETRGNNIHLLSYANMFSFTTYTMEFVLNDQGKYMEIIKYCVHRTVDTGAFWIFGIIGHNTITYAMELANQIATLNQVRTSWAMHK
jgi:hypothetical protein